MNPLIIVAGLILTLIFNLSSGEDKGEEQWAKIEFVSLDRLLPGQNRYALKNIEDKLAKEGKTLRFDQGRSLYPLTWKDSIPVVRGPSELLQGVANASSWLITDGHHSVFATIKAGGSSVPVRQIDDLSHLKPDEFWEVARKKGYIYLVSLEGNLVENPGQSVRELWHRGDFFHDDPLRYFMALTAVRCKIGRKIKKVNYHGEEAGLTDSDGLWVKVDGGIPFIEFIAANYLYRQKFRVGYELRGAELQKKVEEARLLLLGSDGNDQVSGLLTLPEREDYKKSQFVNKHCQFTDWEIAHAHII